jgi:Uma2 family endonuclease
MISPEEYLEKERLAVTKSEYYRGETFSMSGASWNHALLSGNLYYALRRALSGSGCTVFAGDLRVHIPTNTLFTYPDLGVVCGEKIMLDAASDTLTNPTLLVEILSPATERYDRGRKFALYRDISSLQEYILVSQRERLVEVYDREEPGQWVLRVSSPHTEHIQILGHDISLAAIYEGVEFDESPGPQRD